MTGHAPIRSSRFGLGQVVRHRQAAFRGVVLDVDAAWPGDLADIGEISADQPFYRVLLAGEDGALIAYAPEEALEIDPEAEDLSRADHARLFVSDRQGHSAPRPQTLH